MTKHYNVNESLTRKKGDEAQVGRTVVKFVEEEGYAIIPRVVQPYKLNDLAINFARATEKRSRAGIRHAIALGSVAEIARDPAAVKIAQEILGGEAVPFRATLFDKSPTSNWLIV